RPAAPRLSSGAGPCTSHKRPPLARREHQNRAGGILAVADADRAADQARYLDAIAVGVAQRTPDPGRSRSARLAGAHGHRRSHVPPVLMFPPMARPCPFTGGAVPCVLTDGAGARRAWGGGPPGASWPAVPTGAPRGIRGRDPGEVLPRLVIE